MAAAVRGNTSHAEPAGAQTTATWSHTMEAGANGALFVFACLNSGATAISGVTYGGVAMTEVASITSGPRMKLYQLLSPTPGAANVVMTAAAGRRLRCIAVSYTNVNQVTPLGTIATANSSTLTPSLAVVSVSGDLVLDCMHCETPTADKTLTQGAGQSLLATAANWAGDGTSGSHAASSEETASGTSTTMSWTISGTASNTSIIGAAINGAAAVAASYLPPNRTRRNALLRM